MSETEIANSEGCRLRGCLEAACTDYAGIPQQRRVAIYSDSQQPTPPPALPPRSALRPRPSLILEEEERRRRRSRRLFVLPVERLTTRSSQGLLSHPVPPAMVTLAPESVPVLRTPSFSSLSQLLEALGSTPDLHSVLDAVDEFEDDLERERESDHFNDTLAAALASSYTGADSIDIDTTNAATLEFTRDKELPPPPSTLPLSLPVKSSQPMSTQAPALTKRRHALLELLTSERAYASDLALIRDVYMRLASGESPFEFPSFSNPSFIPGHPPPFRFSSPRPASGSRISNSGSNTSSSSSGSSLGTSSPSSSRTVSTVSTDISVAGFGAPPKIQLTVPSVQLTVPTQIGTSITHC
jgi:hypothetical protein